MTDNPDNNDPKNLKPSETTREASGRENILEREVEAEDELTTDPQPRTHRPLTEPEDAVKVDRVEDPEQPNAQDLEAPSPPPVERSYLMSPTTVRNLFVGSGIAGVALIVAILSLTSAMGRARYTPADETQYQLTLTEATEEITSYRRNGDGERASIPIEAAIALTAERGLEEINAALAPPAPQQAPAGAAPQGAEQPPQEGAAQGGGEGTGQAGGQAGAPPAGGAAQVLTAGQAAFEANCASCHQATGQGVPGAFPPLVGHVPALYNAEGGRDYLVNLLLYGLQGEIQVQGQTYNGVMPAWQQLSDEELADILNYISTAWGNNQQLEGFQPYGAADITPLRDAGLSAQEVYNLRQELGLSDDE